MRLNMQVVSTGAITSVGLSMAATSAAIRAGLDNFNDTDFVSADTPIIGARITGLNRKAVGGLYVGGVEEQATWASYAIEECVASAAGATIKRLLVIVVSEDPAIPGLNSEKMSEYIYAASQHYCDMDNDHLELLSIKEGVTGFATAMVRAQQWFVEYPRGSVLVVAVDSWLSAPRIQYGLRCNRILTEEKAEGFVPSEAASAILLQVPRKGDNQGKRLIVKGVGRSEEKAHLLTEQPCFGHGMADATASALSAADIEIHNLHLRLSNLTGEEYFFDEAAMAWGRLLRQPMPENYEWQHPATKIGNVGVVFGPLLVGYVHHLVCSKRHQGTETIVQLSSENTSRAALVLSEA